MRKEMQYSPLVGLIDLKKELFDLYQKRIAYREYHVAFPVYIIQMRHGDGRTVLLKNVADFIRENDLRDLPPRDNFVEFDFEDATTSAVRKTFADIDQKARNQYGNHFRGVVGFDISPFSKQYFEEGYKEFFQKLPKKTKDALLIFFFDPNYHDSKVTKDIYESLRGRQIKEMQLEYSPNELKKIAAKNFSDTYNIEVSYEALAFLEGCHTAKEAVMQAEEPLLSLIDFNQKQPVLDTEKLKEVNGICGARGKQ